jgi:hypothetical protein
VGTYLVETYLSRHARGEPDRTVARIEAALADTRTAGGSKVRYLRATFVPDDETCLLVFEASSIEQVRAVAERAGLAADRVTRTVESSPG